MQQLDTKRQKFESERDPASFFGDMMMDKVQECVKNMLDQSGLLQTTELLRQQIQQGPCINVNQTNQGKERVPVQVDSEITIYHNVVKNGQDKRGSLSSEEWIDTSDEVTMPQDVEIDYQIDKFIADNRPERSDEQQPKAGPSGWRPDGQ